MDEGRRAPGRGGCQGGAAGVVRGHESAFNGAMRTMKRIVLATMLVSVLAAPAWADFRNGVAAYRGGDYATAFREWKPLAEQGNAKAQYLFGILYSDGQGIPANSYEAAKWYRRAAEQGLEQAQLALGEAYQNGTGVQRNYPEALKWFRKAAAQNNKISGLAQLAIGSMIYQGLGTTQDYAEAAKWYRRSAWYGLGFAEAMLGVMYYFGQGVLQDYVQAHMWLNIAASRSQQSGDLAAPEKYAAAIKLRDDITREMTPAQLAEAHRLARAWRPKPETLTVEQMGQRERRLSPSPSRQACPDGHIEDMSQGDCVPKSPLKLLAAFGCASLAGPAASARPGQSVNLVPDVGRIVFAGEDFLPHLAVEANPYQNELSTFSR